MSGADRVAELEAEVARLRCQLALHGVVESNVLTDLLDRLALLERHATMNAVRVSHLQDQIGAATELAVKVAGAAR